MALTQNISNAAASAAADAVCALCNNGFVDLFDGAQPANVGTAIGSQVKLASLPLAATAFGAAVNGVATANAITSDADADATGTAAWMRAYQADHVTAVWDGSVGTSGCNLNLGTVSIVQHGTVSVSALTYTQAKV